MNWDAADYARHSAGQQGWALHTIERLALTGVEHVLDLGCGDGKNSAAIARRVSRGRVVGIDSSADMIRVARQAWGAALPNIQFRLLDVQALDFDGEFDVVFSNSALHWAPDHPAILRGVARALKPGGRFMVSMGGRGTAAAAYAGVAAMAAEERWRPFLAGARSPRHYYGPEEYEQWLPASGLTPVRVELVAKPMRHANREALEGWVRTVWFMYAARVPEALRDAFNRELADRIEASCTAAPDGALLMPMVNLEVDAVKGGG